MTSLTPIASIWRRGFSSSVCTRLLASARDRTGLHVHTATVKQVRTSHFWNHLVLYVLLHTPKHERFKNHVEPLEPI
jgi:hypothetical protein